MEPPTFDPTISDRERDRITREWRQRVKEQQEALAKLESEAIRQKKLAEANSTPLVAASPDKKRKIGDEAENESEIDAALASNMMNTAQTGSKNSSNTTTKSNTKTFFVCDQCKACMEFVKSAAGNSGCKTCGCDLIHHLKDESEPDDALDADDYLEWNDEDENLYAASTAPDDDDDNDDQMDY